MAELIFVLYGNVTKLYTISSVIWSHPPASTPLLYRASKQLPVLFNQMWFNLPFSTHFCTAMMICTAGAFNMGLCPFRLGYWKLNQKTPDILIDAGGFLVLSIITHLYKNVDIFKSVD